MKVPWLIGLRKKIAQIGWLRSLYSGYRGYERSVKRRLEVNRQYETFRRMNKRSGFALSKTKKSVYYDDVDSTGHFDRHYVYHTAWASRILSQSKVEKHIDISSHIMFSVIVSAFVAVDFYEYRRMPVELSNFSSNSGDLYRLPFADESVKSLSCMHVIEHIGLGRYGDSIDPSGDIVAVRELKRVLAPKGQLLLVVPIAGSSRVEFNAQRVYSKETIIDMACDSFTYLDEFCLIPDSSDDGGLVRNPSDALLERQNCGCGCFLFRRG